MTLSRWMGRYDSGCVWDLPGFGIGAITMRFHSSGQKPCWTHTLHTT